MNVCTAAELIAALGGAPRPDDQAGVRHVPRLVRHPTSRRRRAIITLTGPADAVLVHLRRSSADSVVRNSTVTDTGLVQPGYGEGVYIGSAVSNWPCYGNTGGVISGNTFNGQGVSGQNSADSWVDVKGS